MNPDVVPHLSTGEILEYILGIVIIGEILCSYGYGKKPVALGIPIFAK